MDRAWDDLTGGMPGAPLDLPVQGRTVRLPLFRGGVGRASFEDLCAKPLGAADYLAIAHAYHTVIVVGVPAMSPDNRNEAIRFTKLVDALYENNVKLFVAAAAEPEDLYTAGDGAFEFERTVSRLKEMQSADYMARGHGAD